MVHFPILLLALTAVSVNAAPVEKRIAQVIADSMAKWQAACLAAGGAEKCNPLAITSFDTLLAAAGPCDQQNQADAQIDLAKTLKSNADMIKFSQIFAQQPRNTPNSQFVQYCQQAPRNPELNGLFQCQFEGASATTFVGGVPVGQPGTIPFGHTAILSPPGSCFAHSAGPIAAGSQLTDITSDPGVPLTGLASAGTSPAGAATTAPAPAAPATTSPAAASSGDFHLQNGKDAQALNAKFATLSASSSCTDGEQACVAGQFSQCVGGKFQSTPCAGGLTCVALPLVNKPGTSVTCDTQADALARIAQTGATGGLSG